MAEKIRNLLIRYREILVYLIFGGLTTVVSFVIYWPLYNVAHLPAWISNAISWVVSVSFAFLTNKPFVFRSHDWSAKTVVPEILNFAGCRIGSGLAQTGLLFVTVDLLNWNETLWWGITSVLVIVANYVGSKLLVFRKK